MSRRAFFTIFALATVTAPSVAHSQSDARWRYIGVSGGGGNLAAWIDTSRIVISENGKTRRVW